MTTATETKPETPRQKCERLRTDARTAQLRYHRDPTSEHGDELDRAADAFDDSSFPHDWLTPSAVRRSNEAASAALYADELAGHCQCKPCNPTTDPSASDAAPDDTASPHAASA